MMIPITLLCSRRRYGVVVMMAIVMAARTKIVFGFQLHHHYYTSPIINTRAKKNRYHAIVAGTNNGLSAEKTAKQGYTKLDTQLQSVEIVTSKESRSTQISHRDDNQSAHQALIIAAASAAVVLMLSSSDPAVAATTTTTDTAAVTAISTSTSSVLQAAGASPIGSAAFAWLHFVGIMGVAGGLVTERLVLKKNMTVDEENIINGADLIYGLSALSLLISGYFRVTQYAKGWDYYKNEPIFWIKMSSVAVLGALSFFPAIVFFRRDMLRKEGNTLPVLSDALVDRCSTIINAELLALLTIPLFASLMARGVLYTENFPWAVGAGLYAISLGGAGFKYITEAFEMMETEGALVPIEESKSTTEEDENK